MPIKVGSKQLVSCHLPKTGGKTFREVLINQFDEKPYILQPSDAGLNAKKDKSHYRSADVICGHWNFNWVYPYLKKDRLLFVWLRDPVERNLSQYNYWSRVRGNIDIARRIREEHWTIDAFFQKNDPEKDPWLFAYMAFLGMTNKGRQSMYEIIDKAKENLELFDFVGITENFKQDLKRIKERFGFDIKYRSKNVTPDWAKRTNINKEQRRVFTQIMQPEYEIYEHAKELAYGYGH
jgi:hypothetical protein